MRVVDADGDDDTSSPFLIIADPPFSDDAGQWRIQITAVNAAGEATSDWSNYITPSVEEPPVPDAPVITDVTTGNGAATISFIAPEDNGEAITNYAYRLTGEFDDPGDFITLDPPIVESPITVAGLVNGKTYTVSIAAINANGMGPDSNEEEFTVDTVKLDFSPQFNAKITRNSAGQACNFDAPDRCFVSESVASQAGRSGKGLPDNGEFAATKDHPALELAPFNSEGNDAWKAKTAGSTPFDVKPAGKYSSIHLVATSGGSAGKKARFRVEMQYDDGTRVTSQEYDVPDWFTSPTAPVYVVKGSMDRYRGDADGYSAEGKAAIFGVGIATDSSKTLSSITVEIIEIPNTFALLGGAATTKSFESVTSPPGAPTGVSAIGLNKSASVSFTPPTSNGGATITSYTVTSLPDSKTCTTSDAGSLTCDVTDLTNGTAYTFTVTATNAVGTSAASAPSNSVTPAAPASTPECSDESIDWTTAATEEGWSCTVDGTEYEYSTFLVFTANVAPDSGLPRLKWDYAPTKPSEAAGTAEEQTDGSWIYRVPGGMAINVTDGASQWTDVLQWGNSTVGDASFGSGRALGDGEGFGSLGKISATDKPTLASNLEALFSGQRQFTGEGVEGWDTSGVTRMARMFTDAVKFNGDISGWDVSNVAHFASMFVRARAFNRDISGWKTGSVTPETSANNPNCFNPEEGNNQCNTTGMGGMFYGAEVFDQDLSGWDVSTYSTTEGAVREVDGTRQIAFGSAKEGRNLVATPFTDNPDWACEKQPQFFEGQCSEPVRACEDVEDWTTAATEEGWSCAVDGTEYEYADFHILTTDGTDVCAARGTYLPTAEVTTKVSSVVTQTLSSEPFSIGTTVQETKSWPGW